MSAIPGTTRVAEIMRKRSGPCVICGSLSGTPKQVSGARSFTENNVLSMCDGCTDQMRQPRSLALDRLRVLINNDDALYQLIGEDADWMFEHGRRWPLVEARP